MAEDDVAGAVTKLVTQLASDSVQERDAAQRDLVALGPTAEVAVRAARAVTTDPEVVSRLDAVMSGFAITREEDYAIARIRASEAFPPVHQANDQRFTCEGVSVLEFIRRLSAWSGVPMDSRFGGILELRDGVRFYVDPTSPVRGMKLLRLPGWGGDLGQNGKVP